MLNKLKKLFNIDNEEDEILSEDEVVSGIDYDSFFDELNSDTIRAEIGSDFYEYGEDLIAEVAEIRRKLQEDTGFILPKVHLLSNDNLQENECRISVLGDVAYDDYLIPTLDDIKKSIGERMKELFDTRIDEIFTNELAEKYIDVVAQKNCRLVNQLTNTFCTVSIKTILVELLRNQKSIKNIDYIFEKIAETAKPDEYPWHLKDPYVIAQRVCLGIK